MSSEPPRVLRRLLAWLLPPGDVRDGLLGDLDELHAERVRCGLARADLWYARQLLSAALRYAPSRLSARRGRTDAASVFEGLGRDVRYSARALRANPGFASAAVVTLGFGIGSALMLHGHVLASRPSPDGLIAPERLVLLGKGPPGCPRCRSMGSGDYVLIRDQARAFERVSMFGEWEPTLRGTDGGELLDGLLVTPDVFVTLGARPLLGRLFTPEDGVPGNEGVAVLGEAAWRRRLGGDSAVIGRSVILDRETYTIVGVVPSELVFPDAGDPTEVWAPLALTPEMESGRAGPEYQVVARLRDGTTAAAASAELAGLASASSSESGMVGDGETYLASTLVEERGFGSAPAMLVAAVGLVLLISWSNLAGLLVARLAARRRELAVRRALGAAPGRLVRQLVAESTLLSLLGGLCGLSMAMAGTRWVLGEAWSPDVRAIGLALLLAIGSGLAIVAWPALRWARPPRSRGHRFMSRSATGGTETARGRRGLIVAEVALATVLLSAAALLARSFGNILAIEPGFDAERVMALRVWDPPTGGGDESRGERVHRLVQALEGVPGVESAGAVLGLPFGSGASAGRFEVEGGAALAGGEPLRARMQAATPGHFAALGIPLLLGRDFREADGPDAPRVAIVNEAAAESFFRNRDPIGHGLLIDGSRWEVVGVVGTAFHGDQEQPATPEIYRPMTQWAPRWSTWLALRTRGDPASLGREVVAAVRRFDPDVAVTRLLPMDALRAESMGSEERMLRLMTAFALAAVLMSAVGLYGLISYSVSQRTREFGVRTALGAPSAGVLRLVLAQGVGLAATGALIGVVGALAAMRAMRSFLFGVSPTDPVTLGAVVALVCAVAMLASWVPARRATRVDPLTSLAGE